MNFSKIEFGKKLKEIRVNKGLSRLDLSKITGCISYSSLSNYENGCRKPDIDVLLKLAECLNVDINYLIIGKEKYLCDYSSYELIQELKRRGIPLDLECLIEDIITSLEDIEYITTKKISDLEDLLPYKKSNRK